MASPLIATLRGDARNATTSATSAAVTNRPMLTPAAMLFSSSATEIPRAAAISANFSGVRSVTVYPGCTTVTAIPCGPSSSARFLVIAATATLRIDPNVELASRALSPLTFTIRPQPRSRIPGASARAHRR